MTKQLICVLFAGLSFAYSAAAEGPAKIFIPVLPEIRARTSVLILLPSHLPSNSELRKIKTVDAESSEDGYKISLSYGQDCGDSCYVGYFEAQRGGRISRREVDKTVRLAKGIKGYYTALACGVSCTPPQISWMYAGVLYTIQFKVNQRTRRADEREIVALANSAIIGGAR